MNEDNADGFERFCRWCGAPRRNDNIHDCGSPIGCVRGQDRTDLCIDREIARRPIFGQPKPPPQIENGPAWEDLCR